MAQPPYDHQSEVQVLAAIIIDNDYIRQYELDSYPPDLFWLPAHRDLFTIIMGLYNQGDGIDLVSISIALRMARGAKQLNSSLDDLTVLGIANQVNGAFFDTHFHFLLEAYWQRKHWFFSQQLMSLAQNASTSKDLYDAAEQHLADIVNTRASMPGADVTEEQAARYVTGQALVATGFPILDREFGGFTRGDFTLIGARTSVGKTSFIDPIAMHIGYNAYKANKGFAYRLSPDQPKTELVVAEACRICRIPLSRIKAGGLSAQDQQNYLQAVKKANKRLSTYVQINDKMLRLKDLAKRIVTAARDGAEIIFIDTLQRIGDSNIAPREAMIEAGIIIKDLSREYDIPIVGLAQLKQEVDFREDKRPLRTDVSESKTLLDDANAALMLYRDGTYFPTQAQDDVLEVLITKQKLGFAPHDWKYAVTLGYEKAFTRVYDYQKEGERKRAAAKRAIANKQKGGE